MPRLLTEVTELATALGMLAPDLARGTESIPHEFRYVNADVWERFRATFNEGALKGQFEAAFENGAAFRLAEDGLRNRAPRIVEWKGVHQPPGDEVIPADLRVDHVYQVSCKYLSTILQNCGPRRLFDRALVGEERTTVDWFHAAAPNEYQAFYEAAGGTVSDFLPSRVTELQRQHRVALREALRERHLPEAMRGPWSALCAQVADESARRWAVQLSTPRSKLRMLWRLLRISDGPYFVLGAGGSSHLRLRIASKWDWTQEYELRTLSVAARTAGQPEVGWIAIVRTRASGIDVEVRGHVEVRWSHGRFNGLPEAKIYLDTPHSEVPGYFALR